MSNFHFSIFFYFYLDGKEYKRVRLKRSVFFVSNHVSGNLIGCVFFLIFPRCAFFNNRGVIFPLGGRPTRRIEYLTESRQFIGGTHISCANGQRDRSKRVGNLIVTRNDGCSSCSLTYRRCDVTTLFPHSFIRCLISNLWLG